MAPATKICGVTRPADAELAVRAGAAYVGVIFAGGPRRVDEARARAVVAATGDTPVVGVFGAATVEPILRLRDATGIRGVQLHGGGPAALAAALRREGLEVWRVARLAGDADLADLSLLAEDADAVLVEPRVPLAEGGTGVPLALALAAEARRRVPRMVLAGGLTPETVRAAVAAARPDVVDVSSGVEDGRPGVKSPARIALFLEALR